MTKNVVMITIYCVSTRYLMTNGGLSCMVKSRKSVTYLYEYGLWMVHRSLIRKYFDILDVCPVMGLVVLGFIQQIVSHSDNTTGSNKATSLLSVNYSKERGVTVNVCKTKQWSCEISDIDRCLISSCTWYRLVSDID